MPDYIGQVEWEYSALSEAKLHLFWVPRNLETLPSLTTNVEFGYWIAKGKKVLYGRPDEALKNRYLDWLYVKTGGKAIENQLPSLLSAAINHFDRGNSDPEVFVTADWHLGESRMALMQRPFRSTEEQTEVLVLNHNKLVKPDDVLIVNGDVITNQPNIDDMIRLLPTLARFNGRKTLVRGNHDRKLSDELLSPYFDKIVEDGGGIELSDGKGLNLWVTHYPTQARVDRYNLTGHIHSAWKVQKNMLNIGVDVHCFSPLPLSQAAFFLKAVSEFYDDDVHCSQHLANAGHFERGKKGRYLDVQGEVGGKPAERRIVDEKPKDEWKKKYTPKQLEDIYSGATPRPADVPESFMFPNRPDKRC